MSLLDSLLQLPQNDDFVQVLLSSSLHHLQQQREALQDVQNHSEIELQRLARVNYSDFLTSHQIHQKLSEELGNLSLNVDISPIKQEIERVKLEEGGQIDAETLETLGHLLQLPLIIDSLLKQGHHMDALQIILHVQHWKLDNPLIRQLQDTLQDLKSQLITSLINDLKSNKLANIIKSISLLKKCGFNDVELKLTFLKQRELEFYTGLTGMKISQGQAVKDTTEEFPKLPLLETSLDQAKDWINASRQHMFDIITQYRTIFSDFDSILTSFVIHHVQTMIQMIQGIKGRDVGMMASLLNQVMYYGLSLGKVGVDFRLLLHPQFTNLLLSYVDDVLKDVEQAWKEVDHSPEALVQVQNTFASLFNSLRVFALLECRTELENNFKASFERMQLDDKVQAGLLSSFGKLYQQ